MPAKKYYKSMNKFLSAVCGMMFLSAGCSYAQETTYHLPKTAVKVKLLIEKTVYTPGELCGYSQRFFKKNVSQEQSESYRILDANLIATAIPDTSRVYSAHVDQKHNIQKVALSQDNILLAINAEPKQLKEEPHFVPARKPATLDPTKYLSHDILAVGSKLKMAELCSKEIYDIRDSKNELSRGQADYMPKDGEQLRIMLNNLNEQEAAISQLFEGITQIDTLEREIVFVPSKAVSNELLFRFSKHYGLVDKEDLSGDPYYITIEDLHSQPERIIEQGKKAPKDETGVWIVLPGKVRVILSDMQDAWKQMEVSMAQFGDVENLNEPLFSKKVLTSIVLHPVNGGIDKIESIPVK